MERAQLLIDGVWVDTPQTDPVLSPYDGSVVGEVAHATTAHAEQAVAAARAALRRRDFEQHERAAVLDEVRRQLLEQAERFETLIAQEAGKPRRTARGEVQRAADTLLLSALEARRLAGEQIPFEATAAAAGKIGFTRLRPRGVVTAITPFNFPLNLVCHKLGPAVAAGCPVVLKPAEDTPLTAFALAELFVAAGLPAGYLNVIAGDPAQIGPVITSHPDVEVISFTGSGRVGRAIQAGSPSKHVLLELGSASPAIVAADADLELAAGKLAATAFSYAGQSCISAQRVLVEDEVHDALLAATVARTAALQVGDPLQEDTDVGPVIRERDRDRILAWIAEAVEAGARVAQGGGLNPDGTLQPTVLADVDPSMRVSCEEVFGPVLSFERVASFEEALERVEDSPFGIHVGVFTRSHDRVMQAFEQLEVGGVLVNESPTFRADQQPYGGGGESGNTREGPAWTVRELVEPTVLILGRVR